MAGNTVKEMTMNFGKLEKFEGHDFRRWQKKMHFLLMTLKVVYVLTTPMPELLEYDTLEAIRIRAKWENDDYICMGHILNKELWDFLVRSSFSVSSIIDKLPPSWKDFKHTLTHGKDDLSLVQLGSHLRIEESLRTTNPKTKVDAIVWWIDSGATTHVCKDRCWFKTYESVEDRSVLYIGDDHFAYFHGKGRGNKKQAVFRAFVFFRSLKGSKRHKPLTELDVEGLS
ncbi:hypothetical protein Tco_0039095 [Tanacetum coccineum]